MLYSTSNNTCHPKIDCLLYFSVITFTNTITWYL